MARKVQRPSLLLLSTDASLIKLVRDISDPPWTVEQCADGQAVQALAQHNVGLVVIDDDMIDEAERGWLLGQIRRHAIGALLIYVANSHDLENEKRARAGGAHYYTSKPLDEPRFVQVLKSFLNNAEASSAHRHDGPPRPRVNAASKRKPS